MHASRARAPRYQANGCEHERRARPRVDVRARTDARAFELASGPCYAPPMAEPLIACLDLEGVLVPEIWINVAERTGIEALRRTTRDEPDYDKLMRGRLAHPRRAQLTLADIQAVIASMGPLDGALEFLDWLRSAHSGDHPLRHVLRVRRSRSWRSSATRRCSATRSWSTAAGRIARYRLRIGDGKRRAVMALQAAQLPRGRRGRLVQRHHDARRGRRRHPLPAAGERRRATSRSSR